MQKVLVLKNKVFHRPNEFIKLHWAAKAKLKKLWDSLIWNELRQWPVPDSWDYSKKKQITVIFRGARLMDEDNLNAMAKGLIVDNLKTKRMRKIKGTKKYIWIDVPGMIEDDTPNHIGPLRFIQVPKGEELTIIGVEDFEEHDLESWEKFAKELGQKPNSEIGEL